MNKYASFALAFLLVFSGCLGGSDNDLTTEDNTVEPVGETDFTSLEKDLENLTTMINSEIARLDNLETLVEGCLLYTSPSPRDRQKSRMPSSA